MFFMTMATALKDALKNLPSLLPRKKKPPAGLLTLLGGITVNVGDNAAGAIEFDRVKVTFTIVKEISNVSNCFLGTI